MIVQLNNLSKSFGSQNVVAKASFQINVGEKVGLIGPNGAGKTTLLKIILGVHEPDTGTITRKTGLQIGTLDQIPDFHEGTSVLDEALRASDYLQRIEQEMRDLEQVIATSSASEVFDRYSELQHQYELQGGYSYRARTEAALLGVGFSKQAFSKPSRNLSGGEKNRLALAKLLLSNSELLLLDEPTNHLDIRSIEWLEGFLKATEKTLMVVSHDRFFLDRVITRIIELDAGTTQDYKGNYSEFLQQRASRIEQQEREWQLQREWIEKQEDYIRRNIAGQKTKQAQSRRKLLERVNRLEKPRIAQTNLEFQFADAGRTARDVLRARNVSIGYAEQPIVEHVDFAVERAERWAILGSNGSGKTTLLRTLVGAREPLSGELQWNDELEVGYYDQQLQDLDSQATVLDEIRALDTTATDGALRSYLARFLFSGDDVFKVVGQLSGGEKSRLSLARIIYLTPQLLALDEPTNHLDIASREALESALAQYPGTILFVTHDRYLVQKIATHLIYLERGQAYVFDRLAAFEEWLEHGSARPDAHAGADTPAPRPAEAIQRTGMSKNRREQIEREAAALEKQIASTEAEVADLELSFQNPDTATDWESTHRRYSELKLNLEKLYHELASRWELMG